MLLIAGTQSALNRRRWKSHKAYLDAIPMTQMMIEDVDDIPAPVVSLEEEEEEEDDVYDDDDIELVNSLRQRPNDAPFLLRALLSALGKR